MRVHRIHSRMWCMVCCWGCRWCCCCWRGCCCHVRRPRGGNCVAQSTPAPPSLHSWCITARRACIHTYGGNIVHIFDYFLWQPCHSEISHQLCIYTSIARDMYIYKVVWIWCASERNLIWHSSSLEFVSRFNNVIDIVLHFEPIETTNNVAFPEMSQYGMSIEIAQNTELQSDKWQSYSMAILQRSMLVYPAVNYFEPAYLGGRCHECKFTKWQIAFNYPCSSHGSHLIRHLPHNNGRCWTQESSASKTKPPLSFHFRTPLRGSALIAGH